MRPESCEEEPGATTLAMVVRQSATGYGISESYGNAGFRVVLGHPYPLAAELNWMP